MSNLSKLNAGFKDFSILFDKITQNPIKDFEAGIIGAILANPANLEIVSNLKADDFAVDTFKIAFQVITQNPHLEYDETLLAHEVFKQGSGDFETNQRLFANAIANSPGPSALKQYVRTVSAGAEQTAFKKAVQKCLNSLNDTNVDLKPLAGELMQSIESIFSTGKDSKGFKDLQGMMNSLLVEMKQKLDGTIQFVDFGIQAMDEALSITEGDLVVIGARPSVGKTAVMMHSALHNAQAGKKVGIFSLEMSENALAARVVSCLGCVDLEEIIRPTDEKFEAATVGFNRAIKRTEGLNLWVDSQANRTIYSVISAARSMHRKVKFDCIYVDYLTLIDVSDIKKDTNAAKVDEITRLLKNLGKELKLPVFLLCQLNRINESRVNKRPILSDLKESGGIEQHADIVILLHRESLYVQNANANKFDIIELDVKKVRQGRIGTYHANFVGHTQQILEVDQKSAKEWVSNCKPGFGERELFSSKRSIK